MPRAVGKRSNSKSDLAYKFMTLNKDKPNDLVDREAARIFRLAIGTIKSIRSAWNEDLKNSNEDRKIKVRTKKEYIPKYKGRDRQFFIFDDSKL